MSCEDFHVGDVVRLAAVFKNTAGTAIDPTAVKVKIKQPGTDGTEYVYGVDGSLIKDSVGNYHIDVDATASGIWRWKWYSTGSGKAANEGSFRVAETAF